MTEVTIWLGGGVLSSLVAIWLVRLMLRDLYDGRAIDVPLVHVARKAQVVLGLILLSGLLVSVVAGALAYARALHPGELPLWTGRAIIWLLLYVESSIGFAVVHLWFTRRRLDAAVRREEEADEERARALRRRRSDPPPEAGQPNGKRHRDPG